MNIYYWIYGIIGVIAGVCLCIDAWGYSDELTIADLLVRFAAVFVAWPVLILLQILFYPIKKSR